MIIDIDSQTRTASKSDSDETSPIVLLPVCSYKFCLCLFVEASELATTTFAQRFRTLKNALDPHGGHIPFFLAICYLSFLVSKCFFIAYPMIRHAAHAYFFLHLIFKLVIPFYFLGSENTCPAFPEAPPRGPGLWKDSISSLHSTAMVSYRSTTYDSIWSCYVHTY